MDNNQDTKPEGFITRRRIIKLAVLGVLCVITAVQVAIRNLRPKNKLGVTEITIEGPFEADRSVFERLFGR